MFRNLTRNILVLLAMPISTSLYAHHGVNPHFDVSQDLTISGVVTDVQLVNPHSYIHLDVINNEGVVEAWGCEMGGASLLRRNGWTEEGFAPGTAVVIAGHPSRTKEFECVMNTIDLADGRVVRTEDLIREQISQPDEVVTRLPDGTPNLDGNWISQVEIREEGARGQAQGGGAPQGGAGVAAGERPPQGGDRPGQGAGAQRPNQAGNQGPAQRGGGQQIAQSEAGIAASAGFSREDNPRYNCETTNIFVDWTFNQQVNTIVQTEDTITLQYGFMEMLTRPIHMNMDSHPTNLVPSQTGHSIGKWEGDTLVVDTIGFTEGYLNGNGAKYSEEMHAVERFTLSEDGKTLNRSYLINDPLYLTAPFEGSDFVVRTDFPFQEYNCEDLTQ